MLPDTFKERMRQMLGGEYEEFLAALEGERHQALRINPLKGEPEKIRERLRFPTEPVPWEKNGCYYDSRTESGGNGKVQPGRHPLHEAGAYYIQEPSAMAPVPLLGARPGERVLDLCAAPGGKSTQLAAAMDGKGILFCNEIHPARAKILSENIERMGVRNAVVTNETPDCLADRFPGYFDRILVDAPCSGEGMFRKNEEACEEWSPENVAMCAERQADVLECAYRMLRPGGLLGYSTCTFAPAENEGSVSRFLHGHPDMRIVRVPFPEGFCPGRAEWVEAPAEGLEHTVRLWPHKIRGEGHYAAILQKDGGLDWEAGPEAARRTETACRAETVCGTEANRRPETSRRTAAARRAGSRGGANGASVRDDAGFEAFAEQYLVEKPEGKLLPFGDQLYLAPEGMPPLAGLKVLRPGLHLGTVKKNRFEPSHALALALKPEQVRYVWPLSSDSKEALAWLNGETLPASGEKGWYLVCVDGLSIGWGKLAGGMMKNHYPKGLRKNWKG